MNNPKFTLFRGSDRKIYFHLKARNGEIILASESYESKTGAQLGIGSVKANSPFDVRYQRKISFNGKYYFNLHSANGQIIGTSEMYHTVQGRENGIESVKRDAPNAPIEDLTTFIFS